MSQNLIPAQHVGAQGMYLYGRFHTRRVLRQSGRHRSRARGSGTSPFAVTLSAVGPMDIRTLITTICIALVLPGQVFAKELKIEQFYGQFDGHAVSAGGGEISPRDISVTLKAYKKGFSLAWVTVIKRANGTSKRKAYSVKFVPSATDRVYASAMRTNVFGKAVPMDPLKGDPYMWATMDGATLTVHALVITEEFGYEMQTYARTRTADGMELVFNRVRDNRQLKEVRASLRKVGN
ncbi:MAG: hypothetical protein HOI95_07060 [Chromatiales bacterium]|jgi:hypothetical protein|nr:hypothetical protein [Chromatiales bacterium]